MEIKNSFSWRKVFIRAYLAGFLVFLLGGLMPTEVNAKNESTEILEIPAIDLVTDVVVARREGDRLVVPDNNVGSYSRANNKTLLVGHSSTIFDKLDEVHVDDVLVYGAHQYVVENIEVLLKDEIEMRKILKTETSDTVVLMTCAGEDLGNGDATHRLIITAKKA